VGDGGVGVGEVAAEGGLAVGAGGYEAEVGAAPAGTVIDEPGDGGRALVLVGLGGHGEPGVVGQEGDDAVDVAALDGGGEQSDDLVLPAGLWCPSVGRAVGRKVFAERGSCPLQGSF
jgi:hypothetical protein